MKLHPNIVEKLVYFCANYGGHADERKLVSLFENIVVSPYLRSSDQTMVLVETEEFIKERVQRNRPVNDIIPTKFHSSVIQKIMAVYNMYSGYSNESKLRSAFGSMDLTPYERNINGNDVVLVLTSDYMKIMRQQS